MALFTNITPTDKNYNPLINVGVQTHGPSGLPIDAAERKAIPMFTGCFNYFPKALAGVAKLSLKGGVQHGQEPKDLHWDKTKSMDHLDCLVRHIMDEDWDAVCWRALAHYEMMLDKENTL
tara:strand:+ start:1158 stop:1517 length:360 start_codon:yes stop_codon:yes gene_type:complete